MTTATFKIIIRTDRQKNDSQFPLCLRVTIARKTKIFPLGIDILLDDFNQDKFRVRKTDPFHFQKNQLILKAETKAGKIAFDYAMNDKNLPLDEFTRAYKNDNYGSVSSDIII